MQEIMKNEFEEVLAHELELALKDADIILKERCHEFDKMIMQKDFDMKIAETKFLRAEGLLTARGLFEHALQGVHSEESLPGRFNARSTCDYISKRMSKFVYASSINYYFIIVRADRWLCSF
jgi:hypothetical protein